MANQLQCAREINFCLSVGGFFFKKCGPPGIITKQNSGAAKELIWCVYSPHSQGCKNKQSIQKMNLEVYSYLCTCPLLNLCCCLFSSSYYNYTRIIKN